MYQHAYLKCFSVIHRFSITYYLKYLKEYNLSGHQMGYISCICKEPGISQEQLSTFLGLNKGAVAKGVKPLAESGYINRVQSSKDKRAYELYPTDKASEVFEKAQEVALSFETILVEGMTNEEQQLFKTLLDKACHNVMEAFPKDKDGFVPPGHPPYSRHQCAHKYREHHSYIERGFTI